MKNEASQTALLGFVVIGRNEGERLEAALLALQRLAPTSPVVYVDSGSTDDSVEFARSLGMDVVELDMSVPFTAARARNAGYRRLLERHGELQYVHFLDGDCELVEGWIQIALAALADDPDVGIVSGRRSEKYPEASVYNELMDIEWNTPVGEAAAVLGDMCVKVAVLRDIDGFREEIIAAEDDDFCLRARSAGYEVYRLDADMSRHDADITSLAQWYKRSRRGGHGYANIYHIHGKGPDRYFRRELLSVCFWGGVVPLVFLASAVVAPPFALLILLAYTAVILRATLRRLSKGDAPAVAIAYGFLIYTGKIPELLGVIQYWKNQLLSRKHSLIEYK